MRTITTVTPDYLPTTNQQQPTMKDYDKSFIYKITNGVLDYYGSSCDTYAHRKSKHTTPSNACTSKKIINSGLPWTMDIIEWFPCSCLEQLEDKEAWWIKNNECVNEYVPGALRRAGSKKEYHKQRYADNKEAMNAKKSIKHNCDVCGGKYTTRHKSTHFKSKKHQKAIADAVAVHAPTQPQTINNTINCEVCNVTQ